MRHIAGLLLLLCLCAAARAGEPQVDGFRLDFTVRNETELVTASRTPSLLLECDASVPAAATIKLEAVRLYPTLDPARPVEELYIASELFRVRGESDRARSLSLETYKECQPAVGHYRVSILLPPGQHPAARKELGNAAGRLGRDRILFVGTKSRVFDAILEEARASTRIFDAMLSEYCFAVGRVIDLDESGGLVERVVEAKHKDEIAERVRFACRPLRDEPKALTMPGVGQYAELTRLQIEQWLYTTPQPLERVVAVVETQVMREALLNLLYYADDAERRIGDTFDALMESSDRQEIAAALREWQAAEASVLALWKELRDEFLSNRSLLRLDLFSRIGPQAEALSRMEADCDAFRSSMRDASFFESMSEYVSKLAGLQAEYASLLEKGVTTDNRAAIRRLRGDIQALGAELQAALRIRADALRALEAGELPEIKKDR